MYYRYLIARPERPLQDPTTVTAERYGAWYAENGGDAPDLGDDMRQAVRGRKEEDSESMLVEDICIAQQSFAKAYRWALGRMKA